MIPDRWRQRWGPRRSGAECWIHALRSSGPCLRRTPLGPSGGVRPGSPGAIQGVLREGAKLHSGTAFETARGTAPREARGKDPPRARRMLILTWCREWDSSRRGRVPPGPGDDRGWAAGPPADPPTRGCRQAPCGCESHIDSPGG